MPLSQPGLHAAFEQAGQTTGSGRYLPQLFVTGMTSRSARAVDNLRTICDERLEGRYDLEVIDIYQLPELTKGEQIIAAPTLIKNLPRPCGGSSATCRIANGCCSASISSASSEGKHDA